MDSLSANKAPLRAHPSLANQPAKTTSSAHSDEIFDVFVENPQDIRGMIAYCIYRFEKKSQFQDELVADDDKSDFGRKCVTGRKYDSIKSQASEVVGRFADGVVKNHSKSKFLREFTVGITAGIVTAIISPFVWYGVKAVVIHSGAAAQAEELLVQPPSQSSPAR